MNRRAWNWIIIAIVLVVALINPLYRQLALDVPIVTLGLDLRGGVEVLLQAAPEPDENGQRHTPTAEEMEGVQYVVGNRVDPQGTKEVSLTQVGLDRILLQVPGEKNPDSIIEIIGETALLEFVNTGEDSFEAGEDFNVEGTNQRKEEFAKYVSILTGADLDRAFEQFSETSQPQVGFKFKQEAADTFGKFTNNHVKQYLTILLDGKVLTSPVINGPIWGGSGVIQGSFTVKEVQKIVRQLNAGALPVPLVVLSSSVVGPTLGQDSIDKSFIAGLIGFIIVLVYMLVFYRVSGIVAAIALTLYIVLVLGYFSLINATLTLPGIAGFLLSVGMAIDGNIIIFERLKEEIRWGKTLVAALDSAFTRAWVAILDGNVTTLIAAAVLYFFGSGPIKGFAITLSIGILFSMFSAVFVTRNILEVMVRTVRQTKMYV